MFALSAKTGYAILALGCLAERPDQWVMVKDIAQHIDVSAAYLAKVLHALTGSGLIEGKRGYRGGFRLVRPAEQISLADIAEAVEGPHWLPPCLLGIERDGSPPHRLPHDFWLKQREAIADQLAAMSLRDFADFEQRCGRSIAHHGTHLETARSQPHPNESD